MIQRQVREQLAVPACCLNSCQTCFSYPLLCQEHDRLREDNQKAEMDNVQMQLKLTPEGRQQYLAEAAKREERRPMTPSKKKSGAGRRKAAARRGGGRGDDDDESVYGEEEEEEDDAYSVVSSRRGSYSVSRHRRESSEDRGYERGSGSGGAVGGGRGRTSRYSLDYEADDLPALPRPPRRRSVDSSFARESSLRPRGGVGGGRRDEREMSVMSARAARLARESAENGYRRILGADGEPELGRGLAGLREFMMTSSTTAISAASKRKFRAPPRERDLNEY